MGSTQQFSITLPNEMVELVRAKVASGECASDVLSDGLHPLIARDQAVEAWRQEEVAAAYDPLKASPGRAVPATEVRARLAALHGQAPDKA